MNAATTAMVEAMQSAQQRSDAGASAFAARWSEEKIGRSLAKTVFDKHLVTLPNCYWPGFESDLLVVTPDLYLIDVEIKISRNDLKADADKKKWVADWWRQMQTERRLGNTLQGWRLQRTKLWNETTARKLELAKIAKWPAKVWKHYYALPKSIWKKDLMAALPSKQSGVLLLTDNPTQSTNDATNWRDGLPIIVDVARAAQPNTEVDKLSHEDVIDIARLSNLRMWDAFARAEESEAG